VSPSNIVEAEEVQQVGLRCLAGCQMRGAANEPVLDKLDDCLWSIGTCDT
jgi:hypothetical protein